jgi:hypothetical protein
VPNDFFAQMRTVSSLQRNEVWARRLAGDKNPPKFLTVREVLKLATVGHRSFRVVNYACQWLGERQNYARPGFSNDANREAAGRRVRG